MTDKTESTEASRRIYKEVWNKLSKIDIAEHVKEKGGLSYLPWAPAWGIVMEHYPEAEYTFSKEFFYPDGSCMVECTGFIRGALRDMWLPVMDFRNNAIKEPTSREISDSRMRCLVKCLAMWGLGHRLFSGELGVPDPPEAKKVASKPAKKASSPKANGKSRGTEESVTSPGATALVSERAMVMAAPNTVHLAYREFIKDCKEMASLMKYYKENEKELNKLKESHPDVHAECMAEFTKRKEELQSEA